MNNLINILIVTAMLVMCVNALRYKDCGSKGAKISSIDVSDCADKDVCPLHKGKNASVTVHFTTTEAFNTATAVVHGIVAGIPVPFKIPNSDGCKDCGLTCPGKAGATVSYSTQIYIRPEYPKVEVVVKWELKDESKNDIFCFELPAQVTD